MKTTSLTGFQRFSTSALLGSAFLLWPVAVAVGGPPPPFNELESYFDGSQQGSADEAAVRRNTPGYYHFTLEGLSAFAELDKIRFAVETYESHAARKLDLEVWTSIPGPEDDAVQGYDFSFREEERLTFNYYDEDGELLAENSEGENIHADGVVEIPLAGLSAEDVRTFRLAFDAGFRGGINILHLEVTGKLASGQDPITLVRYDFSTAGERHLPNEVHDRIEASGFTPQGYPLPEPIVSTERPEEDYFPVELHFVIPGAPSSFRNWSLYGGMRGMRMPVDQWVRVSEPGGELIREGNEIKGRFERQHRGEQPYEVTVSATYTREGPITGTVTVKDNNPWDGTGESWTGKVTGTISPEADMRKANAIDPEASWSRFIGPVNTGNAASLKGIQTVDTVDEIRHQWGAEAIDIGQGIGSLNRFAFRYTSARKRSGGGSASPVLADGKVFMYYSVPSPRVYNYVFRARDFTSGHTHFERIVEAMAEQGQGRGKFKGEPEDLPTAVLEKIWEAADDVVIAMDAETGKTLWRTRIEGVGYNRQHHKEGPYNQTAAVKDGRVFAIGSGGILHAMDAETGEYLWYQRVGSEHTHQRSAVLALPEVVVIQRFDNWAGFDPATGEKLWENTDIHLNDLSVPAHWRSEQGQDYLFVFADMSTIAMLDASDGTKLSTFALPVPDGYEETRFPPPSRNGNPGNMTLIGDVLLTHEQYRIDGDVELYGLAAYDVTSAGLSPRWRHTFEGRIRGEHSPVVVRGTHAVVCPDGRGLITVDLATGDIKDESDGTVDGVPHNNGLIMAMEDLIIVQDDMTHGNIRLYLYKVNADGKIHPINPTEELPLTTAGTGSYHHPVMQPVVDGRIFIRQRDGIHAYDLRKPE
ncbi:MAG: PQQ-binding-like beta-propeller repeat protein [Opitutales bacterium]|nr:PQQ-binding-like beta-propeller repeat protein [Opitutales bacterium]MCH8541285.1 PQQ-like beta-propeller repeat protein [Opitutales bacterium]